MHIEVDFDVWKALTSRRANETVSYNDVLRDLLDLIVDNPASSQDDTRGSAPSRDFRSRDLVLPSGTLLRAKYKGHQYRAEIKDGRWIDDQGVEHPTPSAAARHITQTSVNGLRFWQGKRPEQTEWYPLDVLALL